MDAAMCEAIRIGILVVDELRGGGYWQRKGNANGIAYSFSSYLLHEAGGIKRLIEEWEPEPGSLLAQKLAAK